MRKIVLASAIAVSALGLAACSESTEDAAGATVENAARAGLAGIAVEAGATLVLDMEATVQKADQAGLFVIGVNASDQTG